MCPRFRILIALFIGALPALAELGPAPKTPPPPSQGSVTPSGKFTPIPSGLPANTAVGQTPAEAEAALKRALTVEETGSNTYRIGSVVFDKSTRTVTLPAWVAIRSQVVEYVLVTEQGKTYESVFATDVQPTALHLAFLLLGVNPAIVGGDFKSSQVVQMTNAVQIDVSWKTGERSTNVPLARLLSLHEAGPLQPGRPMALEQWFYNGSVLDQWGFAAQREGSLIALIRDPSALINNPGPDRDNDQIHLPNTQLLPSASTPVQITLRLPRAPVPPSKPPPPGLTPITPLSTNYPDRPQTHP